MCYELHCRLTSIGDEETEAKVQETLPEYWAKYRREAGK